MLKLKNSLPSAKEKISKPPGLSRSILKLFTVACLVRRFRNIRKHAYFLTLVKESRFVTPAEINVPSVDYVLGLADVIGEYRRLALDNLREGEVKKGEECLEIMDQVFIQLLALDEAYMLVPGLQA